MSFLAFAMSAQAQFRLVPHFRQDCRQPCLPGVTTTPPTTTPPTTTPMTRPPDIDFSPSALTTAALGDRDVAFGPGYLDNALPFSHFRLRFDAAYDNNRPDRAEFFYAKCGCFGGDAPGPIKPERSVDYQDVSAYLELARNNRLSGFLEVPVRFLNPIDNDNTSGLADVNVGFKYALINNDCRTVTFQGRVFAPTGDADRGLGTHHVSLEPSLLYNSYLSDRATLYANFGVWIPIDGTEFAGEVLRYGAGLEYAVVDDRVRIAPVVEVLGWTVLDGMELRFPPGDTLDASGDTIVNAKVGVRLGFGLNAGGRSFLRASDLYVGYGRALTGEVWYKDIVRLELRVPF